MPSHGEFHDSDCSESLGCAFSLLTPCNSQVFASKQMFITTTSACDVLSSASHASISPVYIVPSS